MAETPSRHVSYASRTVEVRDDDYDETLNEDVMCRLIFMMTQNTAHVRSGTWICPKQHWYTW